MGTWKVPQNFQSKLSFFIIYLCLELSIYDCQIHFRQYDLLQPIQKPQAAYSLAVHPSIIPCSDIINTNKNLVELMVSAANTESVTAAPFRNEM